MKIMDVEIAIGTKVIFESHFKGNTKGTVYQILDTHMMVETRLNGRSVLMKCYPDCVTEVVIPHNPVRDYKYSDLKIILK